MKTFKQFLKEAKESSKYKPGEFGYWWTVIEGNEDIEGKIYKGDIDCSDNNLTSLKGCPKEVKGNFNCYDNKLTTLKGGPQKVSGIFDCGSNNLTTLEGAPKEVGCSFDCSSNQLKSLKGMPKKIDGEFNCRFNQKLFHIDNYVAGVVGADIWSDDWNWDEE